MRLSLKIAAFGAALLFYVAFQYFYHTQEAQALFEGGEIAFEAQREDDCQYAINRVLADKGAVYSWTQWTSYANWTHQEQCSKEIAKID